MLLSYGFSRSGGTGRRSSLKICRGSLPVWVRLPPPGPSLSPWKFSTFRLLTSSSPSPTLSPGHLPSDHHPLKSHSPAQPPPHPARLSTPTPPRHRPRPRPAARLRKRLHHQRQRPRRAAPLIHARRGRPKNPFPQYRNSRRAIRPRHSCHSRRRRQIRNRRRISQTRLQILAHLLSSGRLDPPTTPKSPPTPSNATPRPASCYLLSVRGYPSASYCLLLTDH